MIREITQAVRCDHGHRVIESEDGIEGIVNYQPHAPEVDLIITDVDRPNMNEAILVVTLRILSPTLKVIGMSGLTGARDDSEALREVRRLANAFLAKPFSARLLLQTVKEELDQTDFPLGPGPQI